LHGSVFLKWQERDKLTDAPQSESRVRDSVLARVCFALGGGALLSAMVIDLVSVVGRRLGFSIVGAMELVQYCIAGVVSAAIVVATLTDAHAAVHVVTERVGEKMRRALAHLSNALTALFFLAVLAGDVWIAFELWARDERSDLLGLPIAPMRMLWCAGLAVASIVTLALAVRPRGEGQSHAA
jgi:TRAP-type transport system small permease protein